MSQRVKFVRDVPVQLDSLPASARGQCIKLSPVVSPVLQENQFVLPPSHRVWCFPAGAIVQLPDEMAQAFLDANQAEPYQSHTGLGTFNTSEPEERKAAV